MNARIRNLLLALAAGMVLVVGGCADTSSPTEPAEGPIAGQDAGSPGAGG